MQRATKAMAIAAVLLLSIPAVFYFAFLQASAQSEVEPHILWQGNETMPITALAVSEDGTTIVVGSGTPTCGKVSIYLKETWTTLGVPERTYPAVPCAWGRIRDIAIDRVLGCGQNVVVATESKANQPGQVILLERSISGLACGAFQPNIFEYSVSPELIATAEPNVTTVSIDWAGTRFVAGTDHGSVFFFDTATMKTSEMPTSRYNGPLPERNLQVKGGMLQVDANIPQFQYITASAIANGPDDKLQRVVVGTSWGEVWLFDGAGIAAGAPVVEQGHYQASNRTDCIQGSLTCFAVTTLDYTEDSSDPRWIAVGHEGNAGTAKAVLLRQAGKTITGPGPSNTLPPPLTPTGTEITGVALSDNTVFRRLGHAALLVATDDGNIEYMRTDSRLTGAGRITNSWQGEDFGARITGVTMSRDARHMAVADDDGTVRMFWAYLSEEEIVGSGSARVVGNVWMAALGEPVTKLAMAGDGTLVAGTADGSVVTFAAPPTAKSAICYGYNPLALDCSQPAITTLQKNHWISLNDVSTAPDVPIKEARWVLQRNNGGRFEEVATYTGSPFLYKLNLTGTYRFILTVEDETGNSHVTAGAVVLDTPGGPGRGVDDRNAGEFRVNGVGPQVRLDAIPEPADVEIGENVTFTATASDPDGNVTQYEFLFGDGTSETVFAPDNSTTHSYTRNGTYSATVRVRDDDGNQATSNAVLVRVGGGGGDIEVLPDDAVFLPFAPVRDVMVTNDGAYAVACGGSGSRGGFRWWRVDVDGTNSTKVLTQLAAETTTAVTFCRVSENGAIAAYGFDSGKVTVQYRSNLTKRTFTPPGPSSALRGFDMSDDGRWVITCNRDGVIRLFNTDVQDGPRETYDMPTACRGLSGSANSESFLVLGGDANVHLFRRGSLGLGPKDSLALGATGSALDMQRTLAGGSRYYGVVGLRTGGLQFVAALGDTLVTAGTNRTAGTTLQGPVNVTISESAGTYIVYAGYNNGPVAKFASNAAKNFRNEWTPTATANLPGLGSKRVNALDLSAPIFAPQGTLNARHLIVGAQNALASKFDTIHDGPRYAFLTRNRGAVTSVSIAALGLLVAGDSACTETGTGAAGSCVYLLVEPPTSDFTSGTWNGTGVDPGNVGVGQNVTFDAGLTLPGFRLIQAYQWDFDGDTITDATGRFANNSYPSAGTYTVRLTAVDAAGVPFTDRWVRKVTVAGSPPSACLAVSPASQLTLVEFTFNARPTPTCSADPGGAIVEYCYSFGDGGFVCTGSSVVRHMYQNDGTYPARVTVRDNSGLRTTSAVVNVTVINRVPTAAWSVHQANFQNNTVAAPFVIDANRNATFDARLSSDRDGEVRRYVWDFGDSGTANTTQPQVTHVYLTTGDFTVSLFVLDDDNATSPLLTRIVRADDSIRVENISLSHDPDPDNRQEDIAVASTGRLLVQDAFGTVVGGAKCEIEYYYDGPADPNGRPPLEDAETPYASQTVTTAPNGTAAFTVPFNDPDGVYVPGRFRILVDCGKTGTTFGDTEWQIDAKREWWIGPPPT